MFYIILHYPTLCFLQYARLPGPAAWFTNDVFRQVLSTDAGPGVCKSNNTTQSIGGVALSSLVWLVVPPP